MSSVRVLPSGLLYIDARIKGHRIRETSDLMDTPANRRRLEAKAKVIDAELSLGTFDYGHHFPKGKNAAAINRALNRSASGVMACSLPTVNAHIDIWIAEREVEWRKNYCTIVVGIIERHIRPALGELDIDEVTRDVVINLRNQLAKYRRPCGIGLKPATINRVISILKSILDHACFVYKLPSPFERINKLKEEKRHVQPFSVDEMNQILEDVRPDYRDYLVVKFFTGVRSAEINGLKWKYVDFERGEILIRETFSKGIFDYTKNDSSQREVRMSGLVKEAMKRQFKVTGKGGPNGLVFCSRMGTAVDDHNFVNRVWRPMLEDLGIPYRRPYNTRHTAATMMLAAGESPEWIAQQLGHTDTKMLFSVYSRFVPNLTRNDGSALDQLLGSVIKVNMEKVA